MMRRIVIKIGTSTLTEASGRLDTERLADLAAQVIELADQGWAPVIVSSGAIAAGMARLGWSSRPVNMPDKQAAAAVGQGVLMGVYEQLFAASGRLVAQVLLTRDDLRSRRRYLNSQATFAALLSRGVIPIVNENDTVAVDEIRFGDNDTLAALVASMINAERLVILTDTLGLYAADPRLYPGAPLLPEVREITPELHAGAGAAGSARGSGGMATKLQAARIAMRAGVELWIAHGRVPGVLRRLMAGESLGTHFVPQAEISPSRKRWIAFAEEPKGELVVDDGARLALLQSGGSLLPIGVVEVRGRFARGDLVRIVDHAGTELARGLVSYDSEAITSAKGLRSEQLKHRFGQNACAEVIHRNNLALSV